MSTTIEEYSLALFESDAYRKPARIGVRISGTVWLDPDNTEERAMITQLEPGATVTWQLVGLVDGAAVSVNTNSDGEPSGTQFLGKVAVTTVYQA